MPPLESVPKPIRLRIVGRFWDTQIYSGTLYLFSLDGSIQELSWNQLVADLAIDDALRVVADAALLGNHRFYGEGARQLISDSEVRPLLLDKFERLAASTLNWEIDNSTLRKERDNPFPFPHNDSEVFHNRFYVGARSGLFRLDTEPRRSRRNERAALKLLDAPAIDIAAKYYTIAVAAGENGLFEVGTRRSVAGDFSLVAPQSCMSCEWAYTSLVCSGANQELFLASFVRVPDPTPGRSSRSTYSRKFEGIIDQGTVFGQPSATGDDFHWGAKDKVYRVSAGKVDVVRYSPAPGEGAAPTFDRLGEVDFGTDTVPERPISARVAPFGSVMEFHEQLLVLPSWGEPLVLEGEPVSWRVFPRSKDYLNHLHIVYEDYLEIWAFTHDYFADQETKLFGTGVRPGEDI